MKTFLPFSLFFISFWAAAQWELLQTGTAENLHDIVCVSEDTIIAVGDHGTILFSSDGGDRWIPLNMDFSGAFHEIDFAGRTGYIAGDSGKILKSTDGGYTWVLLDLQVNEDFTTLFLRSPDSLWVGGTGGMIMRSFNGGIDWDTLTVPFDANVLDVESPAGDSLYVIPDMHCDSAETDSALIFKSLDGGQSWDTLRWDGISPFNVIRFRSANEMFAASCIDGFWGTVFYFRNDSLYPFPGYYPSVGLPARGRVEDMYFMGQDTLWVAGVSAPPCLGPLAYVGTFTAPSDHVKVYTAYDQPSYEGLDFTSGLTGFVVGRDGIIRRNTGAQVADMNFGAVPVNDRSAFKLIPNPAETSFRIVLTHDYSDLRMRIYTLSGRLTARLTIRNGQKISVAHWPPGIYVVGLETPKGYYVQKLIRQ